MSPAFCRHACPPLLLAGLALLFAAGCSSIPSSAELLDRGPVRTPANYRGPERWPAALRRVAVLPAHDVPRALSPEFVAAHDEAWRRALTSTQRAEFVPVSRTQLDAISGRPTLDSTSPLPHGLLDRLAVQTGADAILFLDLTQVSPYPPLSLSFRTRLVSASDGATIWMADEIFDSRDPAEARSMRKDARARANGPGDPTAATFQSPSRLADHAFRSVADLLPPRVDDSVPPATSRDSSPARPAPDGNNPAKKFPPRADNIRR